LPASIAALTRWHNSASARANGVPVTKQRVIFSSSSDTICAILAAKSAGRYLIAGLQATSES